MQIPFEGVYARNGRSLEEDRSALVRLENSFEVPAPPERAWALLMDVPRVIPCMPGAELTEAVDQSSWKAKMTVKLGPMSFAFATDIKREEADEAARRATLSARAREMRGRGGGQATIVSALAPGDAGTRVQITTDLTLSGAVAQYGRGMVPDVAGQLTSRFADCLKAELEDEPEGASEKQEGSPEGPGAARPAAPVAQPLKAFPLVLAALKRALADLVKRRRT